MKLLARAAFLAAGLIVGASALAQTFPDRPIRLIVPFPPGGGTDIIARELGVALNKTSGWNLVAENRPGAGGNLGVETAVKSAPDGYTLVLGQTSNLAINPSLYSKLSYNPSKDLAPVALVATAPLVLVVASNSPYQSLDDVVKQAKAHPGELNFASPGNGTVAHLTAELLQQAAGIKLQHIPYKGSNQAFNDLFGGQVHLFMASIPTALGQIRTGKLRALAVTSGKRVAELPEVPTVSEAGYAGFDANTWFGLMAPAGTPPAIIQALNVAANKAMASPEYQEKIRTEGGEVLGGTPQEFTERLTKDHALWAGIVKQSGAKID
ncbi:tripartite tricarboxylate transporter substrate binding protein [Achromobacter seleniivolatilans]|uniref:Tripartite tricarboxylate transporter substrate binding protein n=1 Tax=Achromobacter seleniivolatilans TaxID=3047478 RepID=A0ABY9LWU3_9BURK|nr:tripartite tricarboxylate transporter substrate binding protein [Achromobacter sp. R39]WMD18463.1 tripartite tricarboxylate transporter substrate binding protein [Achromobacter sp. R39]